MCPHEAMSNTNYSIMSWNVRGLNSKAKHAAVSEVAETHRLAILNLQEKKFRLGP